MIKCCCNEIAAFIKRKETEIPCVIIPALAADHWKKKCEFRLILAEPPEQMEEDGGLYLLTLNY